MMAVAAYSQLAMIPRGKSVTHVADGCNGLVGKDALHLNLVRNELYRVIVQHKKDVDSICEAKNELCWGRILEELCGERKLAVLGTM